MYRSYCFEHGNFWSSLEQGKDLQNFPLDRVAKFISALINTQLAKSIFSLCHEQGQVSLCRPNLPTEIPVE